MTVHNPYHFIPVQAGGSTFDVAMDRLGSDAPHVTHACYVPGTYSGRILCRLTTETPIFVGSQRQPGSPEALATAQPFTLPIDATPRPAIPASTLRGLLASLAEAASNSALRVLENARYSYRRLLDPTQPETERPLSALGMVVVTPDAQGQCTYRLRPLTLPVLELTDGQTARLPARWTRLYAVPNLKVYIGDARTIRDPAYPYHTFSMAQPCYYGLPLRPRQWAPEGPGVLPRDADQYIKHDRYVLAQLPLATGTPPRRDASLIPWDALPAAEQPRYTRGILRVLGCTSRRPDIPTTKHHELFIPYPEEAETWPTFPIHTDAVARFEDLADQRTAASEPDRDPWPYEPKGTVRNALPIEAADPHFRLKHGDLVWFRPAANGQEIAEIALASIWRGRVETILNNVAHAATTHTFFARVDPRLLPLQAPRTVLTLAEQVFGVVEAGKEHTAQAAFALAGRVSVSHALLEGFLNETRTDWEDDQRGLQAPYFPAVPLHILDRPKPPSPALYFKKATGKPGYIAKRELRPGTHHPQGRKMYLHHRPQELNRPGQEPWRSQRDERPQQKVEITPLKPRAVFYFHLDFDNLSALELGLLLYVLHPSPAFRHKLGLGKPLGLGRIHIEPVGVFCVDRQARYQDEGLFASRYAACWRAAPDEPSRWPATYTREQAATGAPLDVPGLRQGFVDRMHPDIRHALELLGDPTKLRAPVHTPLVEGGDPEDETFQWFVANDTGSGSGQDKILAQQAFLEPLPTATGRLPTLPTHPWAADEVT